MKDHVPKSMPTFVLFALVVLFAQLSSAVEVWSLPIETELKTLIVTNLKSQPKDLWISGPNLQDEIIFHIPAYGHLEIPLTDFKQHPWVRAVTTDNNSLHLEVQTSFENLTYLDPDQTTNWKVRALAGSELIVFNQAPFRQKIEIRTPKMLWKEVSLEAFAKVRMPLGADVRGQVLSINGEARVAGILMAAENTQRLVANPKPQHLTKPATEARYFRVTDTTKEQSYVVALQDPDLVQQAEDQIRRPWETNYLPRVLVARVASGHGGFNRDFSSEWKAPWSWHIAEVYRFSDFASQSCDGNPEFLEQTLQSWSPDDRGLICFWNYRITEELSADQVQKGQ